MEIILVGFFIGLLGSVHCIGMCGPIAIVIPTVKNNLILSKFIYNLGRIFTYVFLGFFAGIIGMFFLVFLQVLLVREFIWTNFKIIFLL